MPYYDLLVRDTFAETDVTPSTGLLCQSPDVIPYGAGLLTYQQLANAYLGPNLGGPIVSPGVNNIYVRAKNYQQAGTNSGTVSLYWARASLLLLPNQWRNNQAATASGNAAPAFVNGGTSTQLAPGDIAVGVEPFLIQGLPPASDHYCLIAVVQTPAHPIAIPASFQSNAAFAQWVQSNQGVAWRNVTLVPNPVPLIVSTFGFGNDNATDEYFYFSFTGRGYPTGTTLAVQCASQRVPFQWNGTLPAPDRRGNQVTGFQQLVPATTYAAVTVTIVGPGGAKVPPGASLVLQYYQVPGPHELDAAVSRKLEVVVEDAPGAHAAATVSLIELGACTILVGAG